MSAQNYYGAPPQQAYGQPQYPQPAFQGNYGPPPPQQYGYAPQQMQYQQPPMAQPAPQRQGGGGCIKSCLAVLCCCFVAEEGCECCADCFECCEGCC